jgi:hypothetical protein
VLLGGIAYTFMVEHSTSLAIIISLWRGSAKEGEVLWIRETLRNAKRPPGPTFHSTYAYISIIRGRYPGTCYKNSSCCLSCLYCCVPLLSSQHPVTYMTLLGHPVWERTALCVPCMLPILGHFTRLSTGPLMTLETFTPWLLEAL